MKRGSVHEVLERWEGTEEPQGNKLQVAVPHIVHEINVANVGHEGQKGRCSSLSGRQQRKGEQYEISQVLCEWMDHRGDGLRDDGGMVVGVVARVEEVVVESPVEPVVEELHGANVDQNDDDGAVRPPPRQVTRSRKVSVARIEQQPVQKDLIVPVSLPVDLLELNALVDDPVLAAGVLEARQAYPQLVVKHPQQQKRADDKIGQVRLAPSLDRHQI